MSKQIAFLLAYTLLRLKAVEAATGYKKSAIYAGIQDGTFPAPVRLGARSVAWRSDEIEAWIASRPRVERQEVVA